MRCHDCDHPIIGNDDAGVCCQCGGRNLRIGRRDQSWIERSWEWFVRKVSAALPVEGKP